MSGAQQPWPIAGARLASRAVWRRLQCTLRPSLTAFAPLAPSGAARCVEPLQRCVALLWPVRSPADVTRGFGVVSGVARCVDIDRWMCVCDHARYSRALNFFFLSHHRQPRVQTLHGIPSSGLLFPLGHFLLIGSTGRWRLGRREGKKEKKKQYKLSAFVFAPPPARVYFVPKLSPALCYRRSIRLRTKHNTTKHREILIAAHRLILILETRPFRSGSHMHASTPSATTPNP